MRTLLLLPLVLALPAYAGTSAKQVVAPAPDPCITTWFAGASVGYLTELEEPMYNVHVGVTNSCWMLAGWNVAFFGEVGYTDTSWAVNMMPFTDNNYTSREEFDLTIMPITVNVKFERNLTGNLNAYIGAGLGMAWIDGEFTAIRQIGGNVHETDSDWVFTTQIFAGLSYTVNPACEIYGGARWIYLSDPILGGSPFSVEDDWLFELGARYKF